MINFFCSLELLYISGKFQRLLSRKDLIRNSIKTFKYRGYIDICCCFEIVWYICWCILYRWCFRIGGQK